MPMIVNDQEWRAEANCAGAGVDAMFPNPYDEEEVAQAIAVCEGCPVGEQCEEVSNVDGPLVFGVWNGVLRTEPKYWGGIAVRTGNKGRRPRGPNKKQVENLEDPDRCLGRDAQCGKRAVARGLCDNCYSRYHKRLSKGWEEEDALAHVLAQ